VLGDRHQTIVGAAVITSVQQTRQGDTVTVTVSSDLPGLVYYHWFLDGVLVETRASDAGGEQRSFTLDKDEQARIDIGDTNDADADPAGLFDPPLSPRRMLLAWIRSVAPDIDHYDLELFRAPRWGVPINSVIYSKRVRDDAGAWIQSIVSPRLNFYEYMYTLYMYGVDQAGNQGPPAFFFAWETSLGILSGSDAPEFTVTFDPGSGRVTFHEAA
jgi:hypothetical protein